MSLDSNHFLRLSSDMFMSSYIRFWSIVFEVLCAPTDAVKSETMYRRWWDVTIAGPLRCPLWCRLVTVPTAVYSLHSLAQPAHFCLNGRSANPETPKLAERYFRSRIWWQILKREAQVPIRVSYNHTSISLSFGDIRVWQTDRRTTRTVTIDVRLIMARQLILRVRALLARG